jgi:hypothetical protein
MLSFHGESRQDKVDRIRRPGEVHSFDGWGSTWKNKAIQQG